ncbi:MAG: ATP-dependent metallopeptidase FtsH/Yme1/Tma family protein, partial [Methylomonas sp.]
MIKYVIRFFIAAVIGALLFNFIIRWNTPHSEELNTVTYSDFIDDIRSHAVSEVLIDGNDIEGRRQSGEHFSTYNPNDPRLIDELLEYGVKIKVERPQEPSLFMHILINWAPMLLLIAVTIYFMRKQQMLGGGGQNGFGKSRAKLMAEDQVKVRFSDVAGVEEAKQDVVEMVDFLKEPSKYEVLGGKIPRGVLMVGPPGTGKTLLARAIAGEAGV